MKIDEAFSRYWFVRLGAPVISLFDEDIIKLNEQEKLDWWIRLHVKTAQPLLQKLACCDLLKRSLIWSQRQMNRKKIFVCFYFILFFFLFISLNSELREKNVSVNLWVVNERWLFSLLWCSGASSVTTNACHIFKNMSKPDWHLVNLSLSFHLLLSNVP